MKEKVMVSQNKQFLGNVFGWLLKDARPPDDETYLTGFLMGLSLVAEHQEYALAVFSAAKEAHSRISSGPLHFSDLEELIEEVPHT